MKSRPILIDVNKTTSIILITFGICLLFGNHSMILSGSVCSIGRAPICHDIIRADGSSAWFSAGFNYGFALSLVFISVVYLMTGYKYLPDLEANSNSAAPVVVFLD